MDTALRNSLETLHRRLSSELLAARSPNGAWLGELSSSALSTATAVTALAEIDRHQHADRITAGLGWLMRNQNADGGWGDTVRSESNLSTTALVWAAFAAARAQEENSHAKTLERAEQALRRMAGSLDRLVPAIEARYGSDRTFSVPITMMLALSGRLGSDGWKSVRPLPFELAAMPRSWLGALQLPVVSYALPALIAIGQVIHHHRGSLNPLRALLRRRTLDLLDTLQPPNGGFLEATPLTSFVTMSLASMGLANHPVAQRGTRFLCASMREDGSWPIDTNLSTWVTTLSLKALSGAEQTSGVRDWLLGQQYRVEHPYTGAAPGGWSWTDLPGGVPDADDTAGALLALQILETKAPSHPKKCQSPPNSAPTSVNAPPEWQSHPGSDPIAEANSLKPQPLQPTIVNAAPRWQSRPGSDPTAEPHSPTSKSLTAATHGIRWLLGIQNRDGGMPTFCRGWGTLPFDRSTPELTAHALRAWAAWSSELPAADQQPLRHATQRALRYLEKAQHPDGSWLPLWFGNERAPGKENPVYGTAQVLIALNDLASHGWTIDTAKHQRAQAWLIAAQNPDGGWGGNAGVTSTVEETALALAAIAGFERPPVDSLQRGAAWLLKAWNEPSGVDASPIGLYFAQLWYFEKLYPLIFSIDALRRVISLLA